jgi:hypothetical protein
MGLTTRIQGGTFSFTNVISPDSSGSSTDASSPQNLNFNLADGILVNQANKPFREYRTLTTATYTYTLSALTNAPLAKFKFGLVVVSADSTGSLAIGPGDTDPFTKWSAADLRAGAYSIYFNPSLAAAAVASGSADKLKFAATGLVNYFVVLIGTDS